MIKGNMKYKGLGFITTAGLHKCASKNSSGFIGHLFYC